MYDVRLKVSYVKGLAEGLEIEDDKTKKLISEIINVLDEMAEAINDLKITMDDTQEYVESIDEDLGELEEEFYDDDDDDDDDFDDYEDYDDDDFDYDFNDDEEFDFCDEDFIETDCPYCHETVYIDEDFIDDGKAECPNCKAVIEFNTENNKD